MTLAAVSAPDNAENWHECANREDCHHYAHLGAQHALLRQNRRNSIESRIHSEIVYLKRGGVEFPACVWQGESESEIAVQIPIHDPRIGELAREFETELQRCADPSSHC